MHPRLYKNRLHKNGSHENALLQGRPSYRRRDVIRQELMPVADVPSAFEKLRSERFEQGNAAGA